MRSIIAALACATLAVAKHAHHHGEHHVAHGHHAHHHGEHHVAHHGHHAHHGEHHAHHAHHAHHHGEEHHHGHHHVAHHHGEEHHAAHHHGHKAHGAIISEANAHHGNIVNRGAWFFAKKSHVSGEDSHKTHHGEQAHKKHKKSKKSRKHKKTAKMDTVMTKVDDKATEEKATQVNRGAWSFFKKVVSGEDSHAHIKNPLSKRAKRHAKRVHAGEEARNRRVRHGEHRVRHGESSRRTVRKTKATATKKAALGLYELSSALSLNQA